MIWETNIHKLRVDIDELTEIVEEDNLKLSEIVTTYKRKNVEEIEVN